MWMWVHSASSLPLAKTRTKNQPHVPQILPCAEKLCKQHCRKALQTAVYPDGRVTYTNQNFNAVVVVDVSGDFSAANYTILLVCRVPVYGG